MNELLLGEALNNDNPDAVKNIFPHTLNDREKKLYDLVIQGKTALKDVHSTYGRDMTVYAMELCNKYVFAKYKGEK